MAKAGSLSSPNYTKSLLRVIRYKEGVREGRYNEKRQLYRCSGVSYNYLYFTNVG